MGFFASGVGVFFTIMDILACMIFASIIGSPAERTSTKNSAPSFLQLPLTTIHATILASGQYSDLTIKCKGKEFKVHRNVVCLQSKFLAAAVMGHFIDSTTGVISLEDDDPDTVEKMIEFLYNVKYTHSPDSEYKLMVTAVKVYVMAEKYDLPLLKVFAQDQYGMAFDRRWYVKDFVQSLEMLYSDVLLPDSDRAFKDLAMRTGCRKIKILLAEEEFVSLCKGNSPVCFDMLKACEPRM